MTDPLRRSSRPNSGVPPRRLTFDPAPSARNAAMQRSPSSPAAGTSKNDVARRMDAMQKQMDALLLRFETSEADLKAEKEKTRDLERQLAEQQAASTQNGGPVPGTSASASQVPATDTASNSVLQNNSNMMLPPNVVHIQPTGQRKLYDLPHFNGKPEQWPAFEAAFRQSTRVYGYSDLENLFRLQKSITGEARESIECLLINPSHVNDVMLALENRFGRPEMLINSQLQTVRRISPIPDNKLEMLVPFAAKVQNLSTFLDLPKTQHHLSNPILIAELVGKLPLSRRVEWAQHSAAIDPYPTLKDLSIWVSNLAQYVHIATATSSAEPRAETRNDSQSRHGKPSSNNNHDNHKGRRVLLNNREPETKNEYARKPSTCFFCNASEHSIDKCSGFAKLDVEERWAQVKSKHICFSCLRKGHGTTVCLRRSRCGTDGCRHIHHPLLHEAEKTASRRDDEPTSDKPYVNPFSKPTATSPQPGTSKAVLSCLVPEEPELLFRIVPVTLFGAAKQVNTYALLDEGSSVSLIDDDVASELQLDGPTSNLQLTWFGNKSSTEPSRSVNLEICGRGSSQTRFALRAVQTVRDIALPNQSVNIVSLHTRFRHLKSLPMANMDRAAPKVLLGLDHCHLGVAKQTLDGAVGAPIAAKTKLGWVVYGPISPIAQQRSSVVLHNHRSSPDLNQIVRDYFTTENFGVELNAAALESKDDARAKHLLRHTTVRVSPTQYQTGLLWKVDDPWLPDSRPMALNRLRTIERRMQRDATFAKEYEDAIVGFVSKGYARRLTPAEMQRRSPKVWYLPHFAVTNPNKPGKFRLVFDAAAEAHGTSLNSALLSGPDLNQPLLRTLFQFRVGPIGVCGDIREMFLQVRVQPSDQDAQRFLWRHGREENELEEFVMTSMTFGSKCSPCSAQYVKNVNAEQYASQHPEAVEAIQKRHYVDDYFCSLQTASEAIRVTQDVTMIHGKAGFELRNFSSNSVPVLSAIWPGKPPPHSSQLLRMQLDPNADAEKILGMFWSTESDRFVFLLKFNRIKPDILSHSRRPTKREVLSLTMSIFDPFGVLANYSLYAKLMFQELCQANLGWDEPIPTGIFAKWTQWLDELPRVRECGIPRCYSPYIATAKNVQLHVFADASEVAFAAVAYWRVLRPDGRYDVSFIAGKTKCAPPKLLSVPRLELQAAILATRLLNTIRGSHSVSIAAIHMWTDSKTVLQWIRSDSRRYKPFVAHRIAEILESTAVHEWAWLSTRDNVADDATRAKYPPVYDACSRWLTGPQFLKEDEESWTKLDVTTETNEEARTRYVNLGVRGNPFIVITNYSSLNKLRRIAAWMLRFVANTIAKKVTGATMRRGELTVQECELGELLLCRIAQADCYADEIEALEAGRPIDRSSGIFQLTPYLSDDKVLRIKGRIDAASAVSSDTRRPVILPRSHALTALVVAFYHRKMRHQNEGSIICAIRERFWIPCLRTLVRTAARECMACRIRNARPQVPIMGQLPMDRLTPYVRPFTYTGLDYFGPLQVTVGKRREKRWVALFTCLTIRAVHLELAYDLSTDACILCLRNFIHIRGLPKRIRSDNGTNFVGANKEWENSIGCLDQGRLQQELSTRGVEWVFNCPANPSAGGCWERLVQSIKRVLAVTLQEIAPRVETLRGLLLEAASIVNSRPLTHIPVTPEDEEPLTPNHFLIGSPNAVCDPVEEDNRLLCHRKQWRVAQQLMSAFWKRWIREFLPDLTRRTRWYADVEPLKLGDLVLICDESQPRAMWQRGRVAEVFVGPDGRIRTAAINTSQGMLRRPVSKLAVLDVKPTGEADASRGRECRPTSPEAHL